MRNRSILLILICVSAILLVPVIAMQFTYEVNWTAADFIVAGILLLSLGLVIEFIIRKVKKPRNRLLILVTVVLLFMLLWAELAVGILDGLI